jgi:large subunit ribosomal protein L14
MIFVETYLRISDNSGGKICQCIKVLSPVSLKSKIGGTIGSFILVTLKKVLPLKKVKKGSIYKGLIIRVKKTVNRVIGYLSFDINSIVLLNKKNEPFGSRINGILGKEIRELKQGRLVSLSSGLL